MRTELEKMLSGGLYDPLDPDLVKRRIRARDLRQALNQTREADEAARRKVLVELFAKGGDSAWIQPPFYCDYGSNVRLGERVFFNFDCVVLDVCEVTIGDFTLFGPAVQIYTATHPMNARLRRAQESGKPVEIGADCGSARAPADFIVVSQPPSHGDRIEAPLPAGPDLPSSPARR